MPRCSSCGKFYRGGGKRHKETCRGLLELEDGVEESNTSAKRQKLDATSAKNMGSVNKGTLKQAQELAENLERENPEVAALARAEWQGQEKEATDTGKLPATKQVGGYPLRSRNQIQEEPLASTECFSDISDTGGDIVGL